MNVLLIYNPNSGSRTFKNYLDRILELFQEKDCTVTFRRISENAGLEDFLDRIRPDDFDKVLIAGGDGTIHQVVNALAARNISLPVGIYPVGTANDFAQNFDLPGSIEELTEIFTRDNYTFCDLARINGKYFINVASLGYLTDISQKTDPKFKNSFGVFSYYIKGIGEFQKPRAVKVKVASREFSFAGDIFFMLIMNGRSAGGFKKIAPLASVSDGLLDVFLFKKCPVLELMNIGGKVLRGEHVQSSNVVYFQTSKLTVECDEKVSTDLDGEKGVGLPLEIEVVPGRLKVNTRYHNEDGFGPDRDISFHDLKKAFEQISGGMVNEVKRPFKELKIEKNAITDLMKLAADLPRHDALNYINKGSLNEEYFKTAEETLDNGYLYVVLSSTGSAAGELIRKVTKKEYSHASVSFDEELETIVSYNGGENIYAPGLNQEMIEFFNKNLLRKIKSYL